MPPRNGRLHSTRNKVIFKGFRSEVQATSANAGFHQIWFPQTRRQKQSRASHEYLSRNHYLDKGKLTQSLAMPGLDFIHQPA